jgi:hypothetical protein
MLTCAGQKAEGIMLATQEATKEFKRPTRLRIRSACSNCGRPMHLVGVAPAAGDVCTARTYSCGECGVTKTETAVDRQVD